MFSKKFRKCFDKKEQYVNPTNRKNAKKVIFEAAKKQSDLIYCIKLQKQILLLKNLEIIVVSLELQDGFTKASQYISPNFT